MPIVVCDESTWPAEVKEFLETHAAKFLGWQCGCCEYGIEAAQYDSLIYEMRDLLRGHSIIGFHCTKLTREEIDDVQAVGLRLQDGHSLSRRIDRVVSAGELTPEIADLLKATNQADDPHRARMLWFCFFEPSNEGGWGIGRFFRSWGGESLYNYHESNPKTGAALRRIGIPCIVKANVPINSLPDSFFPDDVMVRAFLASRGHKLKNGVDHEGFSTSNISPENILEIAEYPSEEFARLTGCDGWEDDTFS